MFIDSMHDDSFIVNEIRKTKLSSSRPFNSGYLNCRNSGTFSETVAPIFLPLSPPQQKIKKKPHALVGSFPPSRSSATTPTIPAKARNVCRSRGNARCIPKAWYFVDVYQYSVLSDFMILIEINILPWNFFF